MDFAALRPNRRGLLAGASALAAASALPAGALANTFKVGPDLSGKSVLITGTSSGFGYASALYLGRFGATVIASMRNLDGGNRPEAVALREAAEAEKLDLSIVEIDVTSDEQVASGVAAAEEIAGGALDALVNNAGLAYAGPVEIADMEATRLMFETNLFGCLRMARAVLPAMRARGEGQVFSVSSQLGRFLFPIIGMYSSSKFGLEAMFESMAYELAPFGVEVTIIEPGGYPTKIWENGRRYTAAMRERVDAERLEAYALHNRIADGFMNNNSQTDVYDIPRAIADIMAMPAGSRPLRKPVHPNTRLTETVNSALADVQAAALSGGAFADWHAAVTD